MTRKIAFNSNNRTWEVVSEEMETVGNWNVIEQVWSQRLGCWVTIPQD